MRITIDIHQEGDEDVVISREFKKEELKDATVAELMALITVYAYLDRRTKDVDEGIRRSDMLESVIGNTVKIARRYIQVGGKDEIAKQLMPDIFSEEEKESLLKLGKSEE